MILSTSKNYTNEGSPAWQLNGMWEAGNKKSPCLTGGDIVLIT